MELLQIEELQQKLTALEDFYSFRNNNMLYWRDLYFRSPKAIWHDEHGAYLEPEPDEERLVLPIARNTVEGFRELLLTKAPAISVPSPTEKGQDLLQVEHNEKALIATWDQAKIYDRLRDSLWHGLTDGWGVLQVLWDPEEGKTCPITVLHHDPYNVYAQPGQRPDEWAYVIHAYPRLVGSVKEDWYPSSTEDKRVRSVKQRRDVFDGLDDTKEVTFIDYWDKDVNAVAMSYEVKGKGQGDTTIESRWIKEPTPHGYGFLPWEIYLPCRLPFRTVGERMGVSTVYGIEDLAVFQSRLFSNKATMVGRYEDPPLITQTELGPDFEPVRAETGLHLRLRTSEKASYLTHPGPMPQVDSLLAQTGEYIEVAGIPKVLQGIYVGQVSGIAMSLLRNPTLMKVGFRQKEIEQCMESLDAKMLKLYEKKLTKPIYLWGKAPSGAGIDVMLDPKKIGGYYRNEVKLSASLPTDDAGTVNMLLALTQGQIISQRVARDVAQQSLHDLVPQSLVDEEVTILAEKILQDPGMVQALAQAAAKKVNLPYLPQPENPKGGYGDKEITMPGSTLASQTPGMPGGNTQPSIAQRLGEMRQQAGGLMDDNSQ